MGIFGKLFGCCGKPKSKPKPPITLPDSLAEVSYVNPSKETHSAFANENSTKPKPPTTLPDRLVEVSYVDPSKETHSASANENSTKPKPPTTLPDRLVEVSYVDPSKETHSASANENLDGTCYWSHHRTQGSAITHKFGSVFHDGHLGSIFPIAHRKASPELVSILTISKRQGMAFEDVGDRRSMSVVGSAILRAERLRDNWEHPSSLPAMRLDFNTSADLHLLDVFSFALKPHINKPAPTLMCYNGIQDKFYMPLVSRTYQQIQELRENWEDLMDSMTENHSSDEDEQDAETEDAPLTWNVQPNFRVESESIHTRTRGSEVTFSNEIQLRSNHAGNLNIVRDQTQTSNDHEVTTAVRDVGIMDFQTTVNVQQGSHARLTFSTENVDFAVEIFNHGNWKFKKEARKTRRRIQQEGPMLNSNDCNKSYGVKFSSKENALIETLCKEVEAHSAQHRHNSKKSLEVRAVVCLGKSRSKNLVVELRGIKGTLVVTNVPKARVPPLRSENFEEMNHDVGRSREAAAEQSTGPSRWRRFLNAVLRRRHRVQPRAEAEENGCDLLFRPPKLERKGIWTNEPTTKKILRNKVQPKLEDTSFMFEVHDTCF